MDKPQTPPILMDYEIFRRCCDHMYQASVMAANNYLWSKSEAWVLENIPAIAYDKNVADFIITSAACIYVGELSVYELNGQWQRIVVK